MTADYGDIFEIFVKILKNKSCPRLPPRAPGTAVSGVLKKCRLEVKFFFFHFWEGVGGGVPPPLRDISDKNSSEIAFSQDRYF